MIDCRLFRFFLRGCRAKAGVGLEYLNHSCARVGTSIFDDRPTFMPRGYSPTFNTGVRANIWGPKFYVKSIVGVCELQHGQQFNI